MRLLRTKRAKLNFVVSAFMACFCMLLVTPIIGEQFGFANSFSDVYVDGNHIGAILELEDYEMSHYDKEYVVYLSEDGVTCEKNRNKDGYYNGGGDISFVHEDCSSKMLSHIDSKVIYEFAVGECDECYDEDYEDYDCDCDEEICNENIDVKSDDSGYSVTVKCNIDADEAMEIIEDMENRMERMNDMFREMDSFRKLLRF